MKRLTALWKVLHGRSCRRGDEARNEPSHGAAGVGGFYWAGCLRGHHARAAGRFGRSEISRVPFAEEICGGRLAWAEIGARVLRLLLGSIIFALSIGDLEFILRFISVVVILGLVAVVVIFMVL